MIFTASHTLFYIFYTTGPITGRTIRADYGFSPSQWETSLQSNAVSHRLGENLRSAMYNAKCNRLWHHQQNKNRTIETCRYVRTVFTISRKKCMHCRDELFMRSLVCYFGVVSTLLRNSGNRCTHKKHSPLQSRQNERTSKKTSQLCDTGPLCGESTCGESTGDRWIPIDSHHKGQQRENVITSSCVSAQPFRHSGTNIIANKVQGTIA